MKKIWNVGIIGYGWAATAHIAAINGGKGGRRRDGDWTITTHF